MFDYPEFKIYQVLRSHKQAPVLELMNLVPLCQQTFLSALNNLVDHEVAAIVSKSPYTVKINGKLSANIIGAIYEDYHPQEITTGSTFHDKLSEVEGYKSKTIPIRRERVYKDEAIRRERMRNAELLNYLPRNYEQQTCGIPAFGTRYYSSRKMSNAALDGFIRTISDASNDSFTKDDEEIIRMFGIRVNGSPIKIYTDVLMNHLITKRGLDYIRGSFSSFNHYIAWVYNKPLKECEPGETIVVPAVRDGDRTSLKTFRAAKPINWLDKGQGVVHIKGRAVMQLGEDAIVSRYLMNSIGNVECSFKEELRSAVRAINLFLDRGLYRGKGERDILFSYYPFMASEGIPYIEAAILEPFVPYTYGHLWARLFKQVSEEYPEAWEHNSLFYRYSFLGMLYEDLPYKTFNLQSRRHTTAWQHLIFSCFDSLFTDIHLPHDL